MWVCEDVSARERKWRCEYVKMWRWADVKMRRCEDEQMWRWADVKMSRCEDEKVWRWEWEDVKMSRCEDEQMWRWADVKMRRCEDEKVWRWEDVKMRRCERRYEDEKVWRCEDEQMWRWEDVKMSRCEDEQMWRWADVKMRRCEDENEKMCRWADVKMSRCEDEQMWRWEGVKMGRCEDKKMWRWEGVREGVKMRRWEDETMRYRPPLLEEPCAQTLSGTNMLFLNSYNGVPIGSYVKLHRDYSIFWCCERACMFKLDVRLVHEPGRHENRGGKNISGLNDVLTLYCCVTVDVSHGCSWSAFAYNLDELVLQAWLTNLSLSQLAEIMSKHVNITSNSPYLLRI